MSAPPVEWPYDMAEHVFLGRAMQRVGAALFGEAWSGGAADEDDVSDSRQWEQAIDAIARAAAAGELAVVVYVPGRGMLSPGPATLADRNNWRAWRRFYAVDLGGGIPGFETWASLFVARRDLEALESRLTAPAPAATAASATAAPEWWPKRGQKQKEWATDPAVEQEAERRLKAADIPLTETAKGREMEKMAAEAGLRWRAESIITQRRAR